MIGDERQKAWGPTSMGMSRLCTENSSKEVYVVLRVLVYLSTWTARYLPSGCQKRLTSAHACMRCQLKFQWQGNLYAEEPPGHGSSGLVSTLPTMQPTLRLLHFGLLQ